jgi:hypothetical protein
MERAIVVRGKLADSRHIELDEPVEEISGPVEVVLRPTAEAPSTEGDVFDFIASLPAGERSKEEIDRQVAAERDSWSER